MSDGSEHVAQTACGNWQGFRCAAALS